MKAYEVEVYAQKTIYVKAKNVREAKKKAIERFKKAPKIIEMDILEFPLN